MSEEQPKKHFDYSPPAEPTLDSLAAQVDELRAKVRMLNIWQTIFAVVVCLTLFR